MKTLNTTFFLILFILVSVSSFGQKLGDVNADGIINLIDALMIDRHCAGSQSDLFIEAYADVDCSGSVNHLDALYVAKYYLGLIKKFPCQKWRSGLAFRMLWFENDIGSKTGKITKFIYPTGSSYKSQKIYGTYPIFPGATICIDDYNNRSISYDTPISVSKDKPLLLGFVADVTQYASSEILDSEVAQYGDNWLKEVNPVFLQDEDDYCIDDPRIQSKLKDLGVAGCLPLERVLRVWKFVKEKFQYVRDPIRPNTAPELLERLQGACGEFTRLTSALLRASRVPAREVHSLQFTDLGLGTSDHGWAECYMPRTGWYPVRSQRGVPTDSKYTFDFYDYLVVYRGTNYKTQHRVIEKENVIAYGNIGVGIFVPLEVRDRNRVINLIQQIAADNGQNALKLFNEISSMPKECHPILYWSLAASTDRQAGEAAAAKLFQICQESFGQFEFDHILEYSPSIICFRLQMAAETSILQLEKKSYQGHQYAHITQPMTWIQAKAYCTALGGHLVTISNQEEQKFVALLPEKLDKKNRVWIGLSDEDLDGNWEWVNGETVQFKNWGEGLPDNMNGDQKCAEMGYAGPQWNDRPCRSTFTFICEWDYAEKKSFRGHQYAHITQPMTWIKARAYCATLGGHLVTISNQEEQDFVALLPGKLDKNNRVWIGLSDEDLDGTWEWVNGEAVQFTNWGEGLPDNLTGDQTCAEMGYAGPKWNDRPGSSKFTFICEWD